MPRKRPSQKPAYEPPIYTFRVRILPSIYAPENCRSIWREIEVAANQTLADLGDIIPDVFEFFDPHLWAFFLSGKAWDEKTEYSIDPDAGMFGDTSSLDMLRGLSVNEIAEVLQSVGPNGEIDALDPQIRARLARNVAVLRSSPTPVPAGPFDARDVLIRDVPFPGKTGKKEFLYIFDFGDDWHFGVKLLRTSPTIEPNVPYPRVVAKAGKAPPQYPDIEDDDEDADLDLGRIVAAEEDGGPAREQGHEHNSQPD